MHFAFEEATVAVCTKRLHDADVNVGVVIAQEGVAIDTDESGQGAQIIIEKVLAERGREVGLGVEEKRSNVVLKRAFAAALIVHEIGQAVAQHDVARLKVPVEKIVARSFEKEIGEVVEVVFEGAFVERNAGEAEKIVFAVVQVPGNGLSIEAGNGIAKAVVQIASGFDLKTREDGDGF